MLSLHTHVVHIPPLINVADRQARSSRPPPRPRLSPPPRPGGVKTLTLTSHPRVPCPFLLAPARASSSDDSSPPTSDPYPLEKTSPGLEEPSQPNFGLAEALQARLAGVTSSPDRSSSSSSSSSTTSSSSSSSSSSASTLPSTIRNDGAGLLNALDASAPPPPRPPPPFTLAQLKHALAQGDITQAEFMVAAAQIKNAVVANDPARTPTPIPSPPSPPPPPLPSTAHATTPAPPFSSSPSASSTGPPSSISPAADGGLDGEKVDLSLPDAWGVRATTNQIGTEDMVADSSRDVEALFAQAGRDLAVKEAAALAAEGLGNGNRDEPGSRSSEEAENASEVSYPHPGRYIYILVTQ